MPEVHGVGLDALIAVAEDLDADEADRRRDAPAVLDQRLERLVARRAERSISTPSISSSNRARGRLNSRTNGCSADALRTSSAFRCRRRRALRASRHLRGRRGARLVAQPPAHSLLRHHLVDRIVHGAAEIPHGDDRAALARRQDEKRVVEAGVAAHVVAA